ncbi:glycosyltransferase [Sphingobacterium hungaricum]
MIDSEKKLAPVVLFVYNRPKHTKKTLLALEKNLMADETDLFIFSDGAKDGEAIEQVNAVRSLIREPWNFKHITIVERSKNWGLANNVIDGVSKVLEKYETVIVLEDDLETSVHALEYFNDALEIYANDVKVMEISGYSYPVRNLENLPESYFFRVANSWGWATWKRAWNYFNPDIKDLLKDFTKHDRHQFSIEGKENFWKQVKQLKAGKINSWAIRWYLSIFKERGLVLYPRQSMVQNIGTDGSGTHSDVDQIYHVELATTRVSDFPKEIEENKQAYVAIKHFYATRKGSLLDRIKRYIKKKFKK